MPGGFLYHLLPHGDGSRHPPLAPGGLNGGASRIPERIPCTRMPQAETAKKTEAKSKGGKKLSGYMKFSQEHREKVKEDNPGISFGQIGKKLGEMWRSLDENEKAKYK